MVDKAAIEKALLEKARELYEIAAPILPDEGGLISITAWAVKQKTYDQVSASVSCFRTDDPRTGGDLEKVIFCWGDPREAEMEIHRNE